MNLAIGEIGLSAIRKITDLWRGGKADSLIDYTRTSRVEPVVLIDADCLYMDLLPEVQQSLLSIFAGYYLQAIAISTTVGKVEVMRHLDKLNPNRNAGDSAEDSVGWLLATESYKDGLPMFGKPKLALESEDQPYDYQKATFELGQARYELEVDKNAQSKRDKMADRLMRDKELASKASEFERTFKHNEEKFGHAKAMDMLNEELQRQGLKLREADRNDRLSASEMSFGRDTLKDLKELANLSVGKMFSVEITDGLHKASIPVSIRLIASSIPSTSLSRILSLGSKDNSMKERYHAWRAGRLEFIRDLVLCQDLIDAHRKNLMEDGDGIYSNLVKRARGNQLSTLVSANPSVATASNMVVMSNTTAEQLELEITGKLSDFKTREKVFKETYLMILVVIDKEWERVTFYHRGINMPTEVSMRDLKAANKGNGPDVSDILKAYQVGHGPSL